MTVARLNDRLFRFVGIPLIAFFGHIIFYNRNETGEERFGFWTIFLLSLAETMLLWEANRLVILFFRSKFPGLLQTKKRIALVLFFCTLLTIAVRLLNIYVYDKTVLWGYRFPLEAYLHSISVALLFVIIVCAMYEAIYYFSMWKNAAVESEALKKENLQTQLDSLKAQISPHFLFNSLSSLSSLIEEDPKLARRFVDEMAVVYRYLLQSNEKQLITLREEIDFINAYAAMLQTRFPAGLEVDINIDEHCFTKLLLPLTLQILLENAVKHNAVLPSKPLLVSIHSVNNSSVIVENNIQPKTRPVASNKMGLNNIVAKYKLLDHAAVSIEQVDNKFRVTIPLINTNEYESADSRR